MAPSDLRRRGSSGSVDAHEREEIGEDHQLFRRRGWSLAALQRLSCFERGDRAAHGNNCLGGEGVRHRGELLCSRGGEYEVLRRSPRGRRGKSGERPLRKTFETKS